MDKMKRKLLTVWNLLKTSNNPVWFTVLLALAIVILSVTFTSYLQRSQETVRERNIAREEYMLALCEYTHQLYLIANSVAEHRLAFQNLHSAILDQAKPDIIGRLGEAAMRSQDTLIERYDQLGNVSMKCDIATARLGQVLQDPNILEAIGVSPQVSYERINFLAVIEKYREASPEIRLQMADETQETGSKIVVNLNELESVFRDGYEKMHNVLVNSIKSL